jgi:hypothetical protein
MTYLYEEGALYKNQLYVKKSCNNTILLKAAFKVYSSKERSGFN